MMTFEAKGSFKVGMKFPVRFIPDTKPPDGQLNAERTYRFVHFFCGYCGSKRQGLGLPEPEDATNYDRGKPSVEDHGKAVRRLEVLDEEPASLKRELEVLGAE